MSVLDTPKVTGDTAKPKRFVFVLLNQFTMLCFASALESLRIANRTAGIPLYTWRIIGEGGEHATRRQAWVRCDAPGVVQAQRHVVPALGQNECDLARAGRRVDDDVVR